jgi:hypothetical protein
MLQSPEAGHRVETLRALGSVRHGTAPPEEGGPEKGSLDLRVMATRSPLACCCCVRVRRSSRRSCCQEDAPTLRSLRLRHPTRWPHDLARKPRRPIRPLRQLVKVLGPVSEPAEPTLRPRTLSRATSERSECPTPAPLPHNREHFGRVGPSLSESLKDTTQQTLCQVKKHVVARDSHFAAVL